MENKVVLVIIDGFGIGPENEGNAIFLSHTPTWDYLLNNYPHTDLEASGNAVGLPAGIMGNSEVGHLTIGSGRIKFQSLELINQACKSGEIKNNPRINEIINHLRKTEGRLHLLGLLSDGAVHSHQEHLYTLIDIFQSELPEIYIHAITDGRDTPPHSGIKYIEQLIQKFRNLENIKLATICGRYYTMDRDNKWERTKKAFDLLINNIGELTDDPITTMQSRYNNSETDEFIKPIVINQDGNIRDGDAVLFYNFRPDRARQITKALNDQWDLYKLNYQDLYYVTMTSYDESWVYPVLFQNKKIRSTLSEVVSDHGYHQVHIAETEKYAHITYFLNGGNEQKFPNEDRILVPSLKVATYDLAPKMSTREISKEAVKRIMINEDKLIIINFASPDMVGHTGVISATIKAIEILDEELLRLYEACKKNNYVLIITSDHGNSEQMLNDGVPHTAHTTNPVPFLITKEISLNIGGGLSNIAPTVLDILNIQKPREMSSHSIIKS